MGGTAQVPEGAQTPDVAKIRFAGGYAQNIPIEGRTVGEMKNFVAQNWGVPKDAAAYKGKEKLDDDYRIQPGDDIEFLKRQGEKGV